MGKSDDLLSRYDSAYEEQQNIRQLWQECGNYVMPRKSSITDKKTIGSEDWSDQIYDDEAINGNQVLASGQRDGLFSGKWFAAGSPYQDAPEMVERWYKKSGEIVLDLINESNFPLEIHEFLLDRGGFGTSHLHVDEDDDMTFFFSNDDVGEYVVEENEKGFATGYFGCREFTVSQAVSKYGIENLGKKVVYAWNMPGGKGLNQKFKFIQYIGPRPLVERSVGKLDGKNMEIASITVCKEDKKVVKEGGYEEQPFMISRFLKWGRSPYGYCPSMLALPIIRQINSIERLMDALAELQAFPRILVPAGLEGVVGFGPSGVTIVNPNGNQYGQPREWATQGRYDIGKDRAEDIRRRIRRAYHVELFQMLTNMEEMKREKTATEVRAMLSEKISHFSPTFERLRVEVLRPLLTRLFAIAFRKGKLPPIPDEMIEFMREKGELPFPKFAYTSKLALAIKAHENLSFVEFIQTVGILFEVYPETKDNLNPDRTVKMVFDNLGLPVDIFNTPDEKQAIREQRAEDQAMERQLAAAESASNTAKNVASAAPALNRLN
eukprot:GHVU01125593.1.p1 GENE.GHVU01125593.1~~GHVU01125593.1.p1  ORF type:complete len:550 (+),score=85.01 GHVU01125593.1:376-2025(+)